MNRTLHRPAARARWILRKMSSPFAVQTYRGGRALCNAKNVVTELANESPLIS